jgi:hypothetical protein
LLGAWNRRKYLAAHYNQCKVYFSIIPITDVAFARCTILPSQKRKKKKKIMFEGFINEHHLFEDARYASCEAVWFFPSFSPSLLTGEGGQSGL